MILNMVVSPSEVITIPICFIINIFKLRSYKSYFMPDFIYVFISLLKSLVNPFENTHVNILIIKHFP
jgi:hypothetical protein